MSLFVSIARPFGTAFSAKTIDGFVAGDAVRVPF
jgi:hypothetical protein